MDHWHAENMIIIIMRHAPLRQVLQSIINIAIDVLGVKYESLIAFCEHRINTDLSNTE